MVSCPKLFVPQLVASNICYFSMYWESLSQLYFSEGLKLPNYQPVAVQFSQEGAEFEIVLDFNARDKRKARRDFTMAGASHKA